MGSEKNLSLPLILNKLAVATITVGGSSRRCRIYLPLNPVISPNFVLLAKGLVFVQGSR